MMDAIAERVAVEFERDWEVWHWLLFSAFGVVACVIIAVAPLAFVAIGETRAGRFGQLPLVLVAAASAVALIVGPGMAMRRVFVHANVWWIVLAAIAAIIGFLIVGARIGSWHPLRWYYYGAAGTLGVSTLVGAGLDAATRAASAIPTTLGGFFLLVLVGGGILYAMANDRR